MASGTAVMLLTSLQEFWQQRRGLVVLPGRSEKPAPATRDPVPSVPSHGYDLRRRTKTGFVRGNNNCFLNASLQIVITDKNLRALLQQVIAAEGKSPSITDAKDSSDRKFREESAAVCAALQTIVADVVADRLARDLPRLRSSLKLSASEQEDSHECFIGLLDNLQSQLKFHFKRVAVSTGSRAVIVTTCHNVRGVGLFSGCSWSCCLPIRSVRSFVCTDATGRQLFRERDQRWQSLSACRH